MYHLGKGIFVVFDLDAVIQQGTKLNQRNYPGLGAQFQKTAGGEVIK